MTRSLTALDTIILQDMVYPFPGSELPAQVAEPSTGAYSVVPVGDAYTVQDSSGRTHGRYPHHHQARELAERLAAIPVDWR